mgnify:CR=1 FL=1
MVKGWKYQIELKIITVFLYVCYGLAHRVVFFYLDQMLFVPLLDSKEMEIPNRTHNVFIFLIQLVPKEIKMGSLH